MKTPLTPVPSLTSCDRETLLAYFDEAWILDTLLMKSLRDEATYYTQPDPLRNPLIFYLGHTTAFFINKLVDVGLLQPIAPAYETLFAVGVDPQTSQDLQTTLTEVSWPTVQEVWAYREQVYEAIVNLIQSIEITLPLTWDHPLWALLMGIEHSRIHFETSSMLLRQVPCEHLTRPQVWCYASDQPVSANQWLAMAGGSVQWGKAWTDPLFGWDMEYGQRQAMVDPFEVTQQMVSNQEFLTFLEADGYHLEEYWSLEGWTWRQTANVHHPRFWIPTASGYRYRALFDELDLPLSWPVEVNYYEAEAFCRWYGSGTRLLTEAEWRWLVQTYETDPQHPEDLLHQTGYHLCLQMGSPRPVNASPDHCHPQDLRGNLWEWSQDPFTPLAGFKPHPLYWDHAQPFFDEGHIVMLGGSWITNGSMAAKSYRNWFRPYFYQHVGFRLVRAAA